jgi:replicative superfamily II helicase
LAAGVNLPADHAVIFDVEEFDELHGSRTIGANRIQQSIGRAGRPGLSEKGYAHIIVANRLYEDVKHRVENPTVISSQIIPRLHEKVLQWVGGRIVHDYADVVEMCHYSLAKITDEMATDAVDWLVAFGFLKSKDGVLTTTKLGYMTNLMYVMPETVVYWGTQITNVKDINNLREIFIRFGSTAQYMSVVTVRKDDEKIIQYASEICGRFFPITNIIPNRQCFFCEHQFECKKKQYETTNCHDFKSNIRQLIPNELLKSYFLTFYDDLAEKYLPKRWNPKTKKNETKHLPISIGDRYRLKDAGSRMFSAASTIFYEQKDLAENLKILADMCESGTLQQELVSLCKLKKIGIKRARSLYDKGIRTIADFQTCEIKQITEALKCSERVALNIRELNNK